MPTSPDPVVPPEQLEYEQELIESETVAQTQSAPVAASPSATVTSKDVIHIDGEPAAAVTLPATVQEVQERVSTEPAPVQE